MGGVIAAGSRPTADAGATMLKRGGNAVDAAVAASFVSFISEMGISHLGGSGIAQVFDPGTGKSVVYDFFSTVPGRGRERPVKKVDFREVVVDFGPTTQSFHLGRGAVAVPGNIFGLCSLAVEYGSLGLPVLLEPALKLAREGIFLDAFQTDTCRLLEPLFTNTEEIRAIFAPRGRMVQPGERVFVPGLERTLTELGEEGPEYLRTGRLARRLIDDQRAHGGLLTPADLAEYRVHRHNPLQISYRGFEILLPPLSSAGGVLTAFAARLLSFFEPARHPYASSAHLQLLIETLAATLRARNAWDRWVRECPDSATEKLLDDRLIDCYADEIRSVLRQKPLKGAAAESSGPGHTTHLSVIDDRGMAVSLTTSAGESAGYVVPDTGFIPNNIMGEEDLHPHGFHALPPGERIHTMMTPVVVLEGANVRYVLGTGGSNRIRSATLQVLANLIDFGLNLTEAVDRARIHFEDGIVQCEKGIDPRAVEELQQKSYTVNLWDRRSIYFGGAHSVARSSSGRLFGAGDGRRGGAVAVV